MSAPPTLTIRRATANDAGLLADLGARTFFDAFAAENSPDDMAAYLAAAFNAAQLTVEVADSAALFLLAEIAGGAVGYAKLSAGAPVAGIEGAKPIELVRLYVVQAWLGRGVGAALMRACLDAARQAGHDTLWLGVWERNGRAQAFYRTWAFRVIGTQVFHLGSDAQTDILMARAV
jgi:diamine N-acetyltransferase